MLSADRISSLRYHIGITDLDTSCNCLSLISDVSYAKVPSLRRITSSVKWCCIWFCISVISPTMPGWDIIFVCVVLASPMALLAAFVTGVNTVRACSSLSKVVDNLYSKRGSKTLLLM